LVFLDNLRTFLIFLVVLVHAGIVYESSGALSSYWLAVDPGTSPLPGLVNLVLDVFVMFTIFFISGYLAPASVERLGARAFLEAKARRLLMPWAFAVLFLIPLHNALFLFSRGFPQGPWTTYFHFTNSHISMSWLWFLPILFGFNVAYLGLRAVPHEKVDLKWGIGAVFTLSVGFSLAVSHINAIGWTKTPLADFQNERIVPYFLIFLLGSLCFRKQVLSTTKRNMKLYVTVNATAWIPLNVYIVVLLNFFLRPGEPIISLAADRLLLWTSFYLSVLALLYCAVTTFKYFLNRRGRLGGLLNAQSYEVYIVHMVVLGPIAVALRAADIPTLVKYPILAFATFVTSNLVVAVFNRARHHLRSPAGPRSRAESRPQPGFPGALSGRLEQILPEDHRGREITTGHSPGDAARHHILSGQVETGDRGPRLQRTIEETRR
jgi:hypothetical protein